MSDLEAPLLVRHAIRMGLPRLVVAGTLLIVLVSLSISFSIYTFASFNPIEEPIAILLPVLCPAIIAPPSLYWTISLAIRQYRHQVTTEAQSRILERAIGERNRLIALVGHDLRGQINVIHGFAGLLLTLGESADKETRKEYLNDIKKGAGQTNEILEDLVTWGRALVDTSPSAGSVSSLGQSIRQTLSAVQNLAEAKQISIHVEGDIPDIEVDPTAFRTVLRNLLSNAVKFTHSGGDIRVHAERAEEETHICVSDNGVGMDEEQLATLRESGLVTPKTGTAKETGTGLGLMICRDILKSRNARLEFESSPGQGTTARIILPA